MDIRRKLEIATCAIASITRHDDAAVDQVIAAGEELTRFIADELAAAAKRRSVKPPVGVAKPRA